MSLSRAFLRGASSLGAGVVFGVGLAVAQMTDPRKVLGFLDLAGPWDASLLFVMGGAVVWAGLAFRWIMVRPFPWLDDRFHLPEGRQVDARLLVGAAIFGIGWGLGGYCPGPAVASLGFGNPEALWVVPAIVVGIALRRWQDGRQASSKVRADAVFR